MKKTQLSNRTDKIVLAKPFHTEHPRQWTIAKFCIEKCIHKNHIFSIIVKGSILAKAFNFELRFPYLWWVFVSKLNFVVRYLCLRVLVGQYLTTHDICLLSLKLIVTKLFKNKTWSLFYWFDNLIDVFSRYIRCIFIRIICYVMLIHYSKKSQRSILNSNGPSIDPWGTSYNISSWELSTWYLSALFTIL